MKNRPTTCDLGYRVYRGPRVRHCRHFLNCPSVANSPSQRASALVESLVHGSSKDVWRDTRPLMQLCCIRPPTTPKCWLNRFIRRPCRSVGPPALNFLALLSSWSDPLSDVLNQSSSCIPTVQNTWSIDQLSPHIHRRVQISRNEPSTVPKNASKPLFLGLTCSILGHGD